MSFNPSVLTRHLGLLSLSLGASLLFGCAGATLTAIPISPKARQEMGSDHGIPYYVPRPYLLVTKDVALSDEALTAAGMVPEASAGPSAMRAAGPSASSPNAQPDGPSSEALGYDGLSSIAPPSAERTVAIPTYKFKVIYLPDLTRQYAIQQRGAPFTNSTLKLELEGGWMFKGTEYSSENKLPELIETTTSGMANILGASLEQVFASLFPIPTGEAGVSSVGGTGALDLSPRIWLFEIAETPEGGLTINLDKPFFEWPRETRSVVRPPVMPGSGPDPVQPSPQGSGLKPAVAPTGTVAPASPSTPKPAAPALTTPSPVQQGASATTPKPSNPAPAAPAPAQQGAATAQPGGSTAASGTAAATPPTAGTAATGTQSAPPATPAAPPAARFPQ